MKERALAYLGIFICLLVFAACSGGGGGGGGGNSGGPSSAAAGPTTPTILSVEVNPAARTLPPGTIQQFTATAIYSDDTKADVTTSVSWSSSNSAIVDVSNAAGSNGQGRAVGAGQATITASLSITTPTAGSVSGSTTFTVTSASLSSLTVTPAYASMPVGINQRLIATGTLSDNSTMDLTDTVTWSSSSGSVIVSNTPPIKGWINSITPGGAVLTATLGSVSGSAPITVTSATLTGLRINQGDTLLPTGIGKKFTATGVFSDGNLYDVTTSAAWTTAASSVATVSNSAGTNGRVTGAAAGTTVLTASLGALTASVNLTISSATLSSVVVKPDHPAIGLGIEPVQLTALGTFSDQTVQDLTDMVVWKSSDTSVATVSNALSNIGEATSTTKTGTTTVEAAVQLASGTFSAQVDLSVTPPQPTISSLAPVVGPVGQTVRVIGSNFIKGQTTVSIGGVSGIATLVPNSSFLTFDVPSTVTGANTITVTTPKGSAVSTGTYTVIVVTGVPTVSGMDPVLGPAGQTVIVTGSNFVAGHTTVTLGGVTVDATVADINTLSFVVSGNVSGTGPLTVTTPNGSAVSTQDFTVGAPGSFPTVAGFSPEFGPVGSYVFVTGTNFVSGQTTVSVGGVSGIPVTVIDPGSLSFFIPSGAQGSTKLSVTTPQGTATSTPFFVVTQR